MATKDTKKRLAATVEKMGATDAAIMLAKLAYDADKKGKPTNREYGPIADLWRVFEKRVDDARGKPSEVTEVAEYNRLAFLDGLLTTVNGFDVAAFLHAGAFDAYVIFSNVYALAREDATTVLVRQSRRQLLDVTPKAVDWATYNRLMTWSQTDRLEAIDGIVDSLALDTIEGAVDSRTLDQKLTDGQFDDIETKFIDLLEDAGDMVEAWWHYELWSPVAITDGTIPAWAALRIHWKPYVFRRGYRIKLDATFWRSCPDAIDQVVDSNWGALDDDALVGLALDFYKECRRRPWGKMLVAKPDPDKLVALLCQVASPFPFLDGDDDFGRVDWAIFAQEGDPEKLADKDFVTTPAATATAIARVAATLGFGGDVDKIPWLADQYYPSPSPEYQRSELARILRQMELLETSRQPFSYDAGREADEIPLNEFLGFNFETPLEKKVRELETYDGILLGINQALKIVSDTYFASRPILFSQGQEVVSRIEEYLLRTRQLLESWCDNLENWPWSINVSTLRPSHTTQPDEETVESLVFRIVDSTVLHTKITPAEVGLPTTPYWKARGGKQ